jgi:hypothetical protein
MSGALHNGKQEGEGRRRNKTTSPIYPFIYVLKSTEAIRQII